MSLKTFHLCFIVAAILFSFGFAWWAFSHRADELEESVKTWGLVSGVLGVTFLVYLPFFLRKSRKIID